MANEKQTENNYEKVMGKIFNSSPYEQGIRMVIENIVPGDKASVKTNGSMGAHTYSSTAKQVADVMITTIKKDGKIVVQIYYVEGQEIIAKEVA